MQGMRVTLRQWQIFRLVAHSGTTAAAAAALALSQSAASAAVNELERLLELRLFDRIGKRLQLNDNGRAMLPHVQALLDGAQVLEQWTGDGETQIGSLRIGASTTIGNYLLPHLIAEFRHRIPAAVRHDWSPRISVANTEAIAAQVASFDLDLGLIEGPCHERNLTVRTWREDELVVVAAATDPIVPRRRADKVSLESLRAATWLLREEGSGTRETVHQLLVPHLRALRVGTEFGNSETIQLAAASGLGITCLSRCVVQDLLKTGSLVVLPTQLPPLTRRFQIVTHERKVHTRGMDRFMAFLETTSSDQNL